MLLSKYYSSDEIEEDQIGGACNTCGEEKCISSLKDNIKIDLR